MIRKYDELRYKNLISKLSIFFEWKCGQGFKGGILLCNQSRCLIRVSFPECILINLPMYRPKVDQILEAEWVMYAQKPKKFSETSFEEVRSIIKHRKSFWCGGANRSASFRSERSNNSGEYIISNAN